MIQADARDTDRILEDPETSQVLDLDRPVAVLLIGVLDYVPDATRSASSAGCVMRSARAATWLVNATYENQPADVVEAQSCWDAPAPRSICAPAPSCSTSSPG